MAVLVVGFILAVLENIVYIVIGANMLWCGIVFILVGDYWNCEKEKKQNKTGTPRYFFPSRSILCLENLPSLIHSLINEL